MNQLRNWKKIDKDGTLWMLDLGGHILTLSAEPEGWVGSIDGAEVYETPIPFAEPGYHKALEARAVAMEQAAERTDPADEETRAFHVEQYRRLTETNPSTVKKLTTEQKCQLHEAGRALGNAAFHIRLWIDDPTYRKQYPDGPRTFLEEARRGLDGLEQFVYEPGYRQSALPTATLDEQTQA